LTNSPDPWNELRRVFAGYVTARLGMVERKLLKIFDQMEILSPFDSAKPRNFVSSTFAMRTHEGGRNRYEQELFEKVEWWWVV
jgi:hypothetical protein